MNRTRVFVLSLAVSLATLPAAMAAVCGNGVKETGEQCDHGSTNGITCCDVTCHWVDTGGGCIPQAPGYDSCHQGTCQTSSHICNPDSPPTNPCVGTGCADCVSTGPLSSDFTCTGTPFADDSVCEADGNPCTVEHCASGACNGPTTAKCPEPTNSCKVATCNTNSGNCGTNNRSGGTFCNDGNPCTVSEQCASGNCTAGIVNVSSGTPCDDKNDCKTGETCNGSGACTGGTNVANGTQCDDWNDCIDGTTCLGGSCTGGSANAEGTECIAKEQGDGFGGNTCRKVGTCSAFGTCQTSQDLTAEGAACTNGNPCNDGFCSGGNCVRRDPTQQSGTVEDYNSCTDPSSTTCSITGLVSTPTCVTGTCVACQIDCGTLPTGELFGTPVPCGCTYSQ